MSPTRRRRPPVDILLATGGSSIEPGDNMYYTGGMPKMGRPKVSPAEIRDSMVNIRMTEQEKRALRRKAGKLTVTEYLHALIFGRAPQSPR